MYFNEFEDRLLPQHMDSQPETQCESVKKPTNSMDY